MTDQANLGGARGQGVTTSTYYSFCNDTVKEPIAVVNTGDDGHVPVEVSFRHVPPGAGGRGHATERTGSPLASA